MATTDLAMDLRMNLGNLRRDVGEAQGIVRGFGSSLAGLSPGRGLAAIGAAVALTVTEFAKADKANEDLRSALAATGAEVDSNYRSMSAFADSMRNSTVYSAAMVKNLQAMALNLGVSAEQTNEVTKAGIGLGQRFFGGDATRGIQAAAFAVQGNTERLREMIPALRQTKNESAQLAIVNKAATAGFAEAQNRAKTFSGSLALLSRGYHEAGAAVGSAFAPEVERLAGLLTGVAEKIAGMTDAQKHALVTETELTAGTLGSAVALGKVGTTLTGLRGLFGSMSPAVGAVGIALGGLGAMFVNMTGKGETFGERLNDVWEKLAAKVGNVSERIEKTWRGVTDAIVSLYFHVLEAFGEGDANKLFEQYTKDVEAATKAAAEAQAANTKAGVDKTVNLQKEGIRNIKADISTVPGAYRNLQMEILKYANETAVKQVAIDKKAKEEMKKPASGGGAAGGAGAAGPDTFGQPTPDVMAKANARRVAEAEKEKIRIEKALERIGPNGDPTLKATLESAYARAEGTIRRKGEPLWYRPNSADELMDDMQARRDRAEQTGLPEQSGRLRDDIAKLERGKNDPAYRSHIETPEEQMRRGMGGIGGKELLDAATALKVSADSLGNVAKNQRVVGVVKD